MRSLNRPRRLLLTGALIVIVAGASGLLWWITRPQTERIVLADGTAATGRTDSKWVPATGFPHPREVQVDGEFIVEAAAGPEPLTIHSRLLTLKVNGKSTFRIVARSIEPGAEVEVLEGDVTAYKSYRSDYNELDHLIAGDMSMLNQTIDLMEKEKFDVSEAKAWREELR